MPLDRMTDWVRSKTSSKHSKDSEAIKWRIESEGEFVAVIHEKLKAINPPPKKPPGIAECIQAAYDIVSPYEHSYRTLTKELESFQQKYNKDVSELRVERDNIAQDCKGLRFWNVKHQDDLKGLRSRIVRKDEDIGRKDMVIRNLNEDLSEQVRRISNLDLELSQIRTAWNQHVLQIQLEAENARVALETSKNQDLSDLRRTHEAETERQRQHHIQQIEEARCMLEDTKLRAEGRMREIVEQHNAAVFKLESDCSDAISAEKKDNERARRQLENDYKLSTEKLYSDNGELNSALLTRDNEQYQAALFQTSGLPRKTDAQIRDSVVEVYQQVEHLGRRATEAWRAEQPEWSTQLLEKFTNQQVSRELRRAIVQDAIWDILFSKVFGSPFRIFGEAGQSLDRQWFDQCGRNSSNSDSFQWPTPSVSAERWRYFTMKGARDALTTKLSPIDPRAALKRGYKTCQDALTLELRDALNELIDLSTSDLEKIQRLPKLVFPLWLDFSMHRCRIVLRSKDGETRSMRDRASVAQEESVTLMLQPLVGRYGNVKGLDLESFTPIDGCAGESLTVP